MNGTARLIMAVLTLAPSLFGCQADPEFWRALPLPAIPSPAWNGDQPDPLVARTLRLVLDDGRRLVLFSEEGSPVETTPGKPLSMAFVASQPFASVELLAAAWGGDDARAGLRLLDEAGAVIADSTTSPFVDRTWVRLAGPTLPPGRYRLELRRAGSDRVGWWSAKLGNATARGVPGPPPFQVETIPEFAGGEVVIPVNARAERLAFLGGRSSYDHGIGWWRDYEVQRDSSDRQFLGDIAGWVSVEYESGRIDRIPLAFGFTVWWTAHLSGDHWGGPFPEPFASDGLVRQAAEKALRLRSVGSDALTPEAWEYQPAPEKIRLVRLIDNPALQGFPIFGAVSILTRDRAEHLRPLAGSGRTERPILPEELTNDRWREPVLDLRNLLYRRESDLPPQPALPGPTDPDIRITGGRGDLLTGIWRANLADMRSKFAADGRFRTSSPGAANYGAYQGIGAWREEVGFFAAQVWARDLGRAAIELTRLGDTARIEGALRFAGDRLYDLPNGYPRLARRGERIPPRWPTVLGEPLYLDADREGDGNWENDSQGLLILAYSRAWVARSHDQAWLAGHVGTVRDAANWYLEQLDRPERWKGRNGLLYGEGEAANDGGYDVLSNTLAWRALLAAATMVEAVGELEQAARYRTAAERIRTAVNRELTDRDAGGFAWRSTAWNWGYGHESLGPILTAPDVGDYHLESLTGIERTIAEVTYRRQLGRCPNLTCVRAVGYGQAYLAQAALLLDDLKTTGALLDRLAVVSHDSRLGPYLIPEGIAMDPEGTFWYRTGDLGNAVHQAEVLKALSLVAGVESNGPGRLRVLPRMAESWQSVTIDGWPTPAGPVSYSLVRSSQQLRLEIALPESAAIRFGPLPASAQVSIDGAAAVGRRTSDGGLSWIWIENIPAGRHRIETLP